VSHAGPTQQWRNLTPSPGMILEAKAYTDSNRGQGTHCVRVLRPLQVLPGNPPQGAVGAWFEAEHLGASDPWYEWWATEGEGRLSRVYHLCPLARSGCRRLHPPRVPGGPEPFIHIDKCRVLSELPSYAAGREGNAGLATPTVPQPALHVPPCLPGASFASPSLPGGFPPPPAGTPLVLPEPPEDTTLRGVGETVPGPQLPSAGEGGPVPGGVGNVDPGAGVPDLARRLSHLAEGLDPSSALGPSGNEVERRLEELRTRLHHARPPAQPARTDTGGPLRRKDLLETIASRAQGLSQSRNSRSERGRTSGVPLVVIDPSQGHPDAAALGPPRGRSETRSRSRRRRRSYRGRRSRSRTQSTSRSGGSEEERGEGRHHHHSLSRLHRRRPGRLAARFIDTLTTLVGERGLGQTEEVVKPVATTYLLTVFFVHHPPRELGLRTERELRTLMLCIDHLIRGDVGRCLDVLCQRVKALERSVIDQTWTTARWLELIPTSDSMLVSREEAREAIRENEAEARVRRPPQVTQQRTLSQWFPSAPNQQPARGEPNPQRQEGANPSGAMLALPPPPGPPTGGSRRKPRRGAGRG
jgi:hypothetical protein